MAPRTHSALFCLEAGSLPPLQTAVSRQGLRQACGARHSAVAVAAFPIRQACWLPRAISFLPRGALQPQPGGPVAGGAASQSPGGWQCLRSTPSVWVPRPLSAPVSAPASRGSHPWSWHKLRGWSLRRDLFCDLSCVTCGPVPLNKSCPLLPAARPPGRHAGRGPSERHETSSQWSVGFALQVENGVRSFRDVSPVWSLRALRALMRAVFALQAGPHPDRALHPHLRAGLRDSAGGDAEGHGLQHQEVPARPGSGRGSALLGLWGLAALSAPLLPGPALAPSTWLQGGLGFRSASVGRLLGGPTLGTPGLT